MNNNLISETNFHDSERAQKTKEKSQNQFGGAYNTPKLHPGAV